MLLDSADVAAREARSLARRAASRRVLRSFAAALVMLSLVGVLSLWNTRQLIESEGHVARSYRRLSDVNLVMQLLSDAEAGPRGYMLTGSDLFLEPYRMAQKEMSAPLDRLSRDLGPEDAQQAAEVKELRRLVERRIEAIEMVLALWTSGDMETARRELAFGRGAQFMRTVRSQTRRIKDHESEQITANTRLTTQLAQWTLWIIALGGVWSVTLVGSSLLCLRGDIAEREHAEDELEDQRALLRQFVEHTPAAVAMFDTQMRPILRSRRWQFDIERLPLDGLGAAQAKPDGAARDRSEWTLPQTWWDAVERSMRGMVESRSEEQMTHADGSRDWVRWEVRPWQAPNGGVGGVISFVENITERKRAADAQRESEARYREVVQGVQEVIFRADSDGRWAFLNRAWTDVTGYDVRESLGQRLFSWLHAEDREVAQQNFQGLMGGAYGECFFEARLLSKDGVYKRCEVRARGVRGEDGRIVEATGTINDVTERKQAEDALRESEGELRVLFSEMSEVVLQLDREGRYRKVAPTRPDLLFRPAEELLGRSLHEVFEPEMADRLLSKIHQVLATQQRNLVEYELPIEGRAMVFEASVTPLSSDAVLFVARDVTEQRQESRRRERVSQGLRAVLDATDELLQAPDVESVLRRAVELSRERLGTDRTAIFLAAPDGTYVRGTFGTDINGATTDERIVRIIMPPNEDWRTFFAKVPPGERRTIKSNRPLYSLKNSEAVTTGQIGDIGVTLIPSTSGFIGSLHNDNGITNRPLDDLQQEMLVVFCSLLGNIIESKRSAEALRAARDELEQRVQSRTADLVRANDDLQAEIVERERAQQHEAALSQGLRTVLSCADELLLAGDLDTLLRRAVELGHERLGLERVSIFLLDPETKALRGTYGINSDGSLVAQYENINEVAQQWEAAVAQQVEHHWFVMGEDCPHSDWVGGQMVETSSKGWEVATPIRSASGPIGVMFNDSAISGGPFNETLQGIVALYASLLGNIIERIGAEAALRQSEVRFRQMTEAMPHVVWTAGPDGGLSYVNAHTLGYTGVPVDSILEMNWRNVMHPDDAKRIYPRYIKSVREAISYSDEYRLRRHDGEFRWHASRTDPIRNAAGQVEMWVGSAIDIDDQKKAEATLRRDRDEMERLVNERTGELSRANVELQAEINERRQTEIALRDSEERFRAFMNSSTFIAFMKNSQGRYAYLNEPFCHRFHIKPDQWLGKTVFDVLPQDVARRMDEMDQQVLVSDQEQTTSSYDTLLLPEGEVTWLTFRFPLRDARGSKYLAGVAFDVSEQQRSARALEEATQELRRSNADLEQFAYVASHDLQEPLRMVASYLQLLERRYASSLDANAHEFIGYAVDGARRMQSLINDLLDYSRLGRRDREFAPVDLDSVLDGALANLSVAIAEAGAQVRRDSLPVVLGDASQLARLFQNLLANAIKFRGERAPEILVECRDRGAEWELQVRDNGIGIAAQHHERIFAVFQRLHSREEYQGTGIGLAIVKKIVERHGGNIRVESEAGQGSAFIWTVPKLQSSPAAVPSPLGPVPTALPAPASAPSSPSALSAALIEGARDEPQAQSQVLGGAAGNEMDRDVEER
jgi:PAS domain S-box-containing protein